MITTIGTELVKFLNDKSAVKSIFASTSAPYLAENAVSDSTGLFAPVVSSSS